MEDPLSSLSTHHIKSVPPIHKAEDTTSVSNSPEHSRARSKRTRVGDEHSYEKRRRESYADGTRRGRSRTRSVSPESAKRRTMRRRRSRSPSRSCSTSATEMLQMQSSIVKRQRRSQNDQAKDEHVKEDIQQVLARDGSRESMRSRSKRRKKYRRRSDHAAAAADSARTTLRRLRGVRSTGDPTQNRDLPDEGRNHDRKASFEGVLEEDDEEVG